VGSVLDLLRRWHRDALVHEPNSAERRRSVHGCQPTSMQHTSVRVSSERRLVPVVRLHGTLRWRHPNALLHQSCPFQRRRCLHWAQPTALQHASLPCQRPMGPVVNLPCHLHQRRSNVQCANSLVQQSCTREWRPYVLWSVTANVQHTNLRCASCQRRLVSVDSVFAAVRWRLSNEKLHQPATQQRRTDVRWRDDDRLQHSGLRGSACQRWLDGVVDLHSVLRHRHTISHVHLTNTSKRRRVLHRIQHTGLQHQPLLCANQRRLERVAVMQCCLRWWYSGPHVHKPNSSKRRHILLRG
jgi:hypothetical protein